MISSIKSLTREIANVWMSILSLTNTGLWHTEKSLEFTKKIINKSLINYYNNATISCIALGSPYKFHVDSQASGCLTAYGPGLSGGRTGEPAVFTISTKGAEVPLLSLSVEGPSKAKVSYNHKLSTVFIRSFASSNSWEFKLSSKISCDLFVGCVTTTNFHHYKNITKLSQHSGVLHKDLLHFIIIHSQFNVLNDENFSWKF